MPSPLFCMPEEGRTIMPEEALQAAFEIKTACDEISRRLLRWHWEHKPGAHSLGALLDHVAQRQQESPDYYDRMPDLSGKNSWQQLDTTICMRVLLDPEKDAAKPLDLLGIPAIRVRPAAPAMLCAPPATKPPTPPITPMPLRRQSCSTRRWRAWKTAMWARLSARMNLPTITAMQKIIWHAAAQRSQSHPAVRRKKKRLRTSQPARAQSRARTAAPRAAKRPAAVPPAAEAPQRAAARPKAAARQAAKRNREELAIKPCSSFCWWSCCWGLPCVHGAWAQPDRL